MIRLTSIFVALLYVVLSTGVHIHLHYCKEKLADLSIFGGDDCCHHAENDSCSGHEQCCDFEEVHIVLDVDHITPAQIEIRVIDVPVILPAFLIQVDESIAQQLVSETEQNKGSPPSYPSIYKITQSYIYYG